METQIITAANHYSHVITTHVNETNPELNNEFFKELTWEMSSLNPFPLDEMGIFSCIGIVYSHNILESIKLEHLKNVFFFFLAVSKECKNTLPCKASFYPHSLFVLFHDKTEMHLKIAPGT